jgi:hypothetical protein
VYKHYIIVGEQRDPTRHRIRYFMPASTEKVVRLKIRKTRKKENLTTSDWQIANTIEAQAGLAE